MGHSRNGTYILSNLTGKPTIWWTSCFRAPVCLVMGIMICEDVELSFEGKASIKREGRIEIPVGEITLAAGALNTVSNASDPQGSFASNRQTVTIFKGQTGKSRIFALELRKISMKGWIWKDLDLQNEGPAVDATRLAANGESGDEEDADERPNIEDLVLTRLGQEEYKEIE